MISRRGYNPRCTSKSSTYTMLRSGRTRLMSTKRSKIAISSSSINNRGRVLTSSNGSIRILKCYKAITLGSASVFISNNNSFQNFTKLFKIPSHGMSLSLPSQTSNKNFGESRVIVLASKAKAAVIVAAANVMKLPLLRHKGN